jgi:TonB-linked SusC/RagA family outer membrane protein
MRRISVVLCMLLWFATAWAQNKQITGKVTDVSGNPLPGISVKVKGAKGGVTTDANGNFTIPVPPNGTLQFTGIGFEQRDVAVTNQTSVDVQLAIEAKSLSEVVVTGVGVATDKRKVAIDVASLNSKDVAKSAVASVEQALQGKIAGAQVQFPSGTPGTGATIILRGVNSLGSSQPMILLDGVEVLDLNGLDLSSVERVEVVKGAAAGMLYGAQGANGVIQVFTKKGSRNKKPTISFFNQASFDQVITGDRPLVASMHHFETDAQGYIIKNGQRIHQDQFGAWPDPVFLDPIANPEVKNDKPYKEPIYDHLAQSYSKAFTNNTSVNIAGGGDRSDYSFTVSNLAQQNVLSNTYNRVNIGANLGFELAKGLTFRNINQVIITKENLLSGDADPQLGQTNSNRFLMTNSWPYIDFKFRDSSGFLVVKPKQNENQLNPLSEPEWRERDNRTYRIVENANLNYKFPRFLELDYKFGLELWNEDGLNYYKNQEDAPQSATAAWGPSRYGSIRSDYTRTTWINSLATAFLKFDFQNDFHSNLPIKAITQVAYDYRNEKFKTYYAQGTVLPNYPPANISVAQNKTSADNSDEFTTFGWLLNQSLDWANLAGISAGFRSDYSSEFGDAKKPFNFPRGTVYFRPSELLRKNFLADWKLRAAYGEAGIQPERYARQVTLGVQPLGTGVGLNLPIQASNPNLKVQRSKELEIGTDATIITGFQNWLTRITLSASWWSRKGEDIIQSANMATSSGYESIIDNLSTLESKGYDITIDANVLDQQNLTWQFGFRLGHAKTTVTHIANNADIINGLFAVKEGQELGIFYAPTPLHSLDQTRPDGTRYIADADKGKYELVDGMVTNKTTKQVVITDANDQSVLGSALPRFNASFINTFTIYKHLTASFQVDWYYGNKIYNMTRQWLYRDRLSKDYDDKVTINGETGAFVAFYNSLYNSVQPISWFVEDGSFLRLRDASITYNFTDLIKKPWAKNVSVTLAGRNLFTITNYKGLDPEATSTADSQGNESTAAGQTRVGAVKGSDYFAVPNLKSFIVSLNLGF